MDFSLAGLGLVPVPALDEPAEESWEELERECARELAERGFDLEGGLGATSGFLGGDSGEAAWLEIAKVLAPAMFTALGIWLQARYGRKVRLKVGDIEAEARTKEEVEQLIARAQEIQRRNEPKRIHER